MRTFIKFKYLPWASFMFGMSVILLSCSEKEEPIIEPDPEPQINCVESERVEGWRQDTLVTGYIFNYPDYIININKNQKRRVYQYEDDSTYVKLTFGSCQVAVDPCLAIPYVNLEIVYGGYRKAVPVVQAFVMGTGSTTRQTPY